ncbi:MAG: hypothetical protein OK422_01485 [Thaumarchaeota archaeon]|nr:hypothetical protein [Nitrososphaerota archaeon]
MTVAVSFTAAIALSVALTSTDAINPAFCRAIEALAAALVKSCIATLAAWIPLARFVFESRSALAVASDVSPALNRDSAEAVLRPAAEAEAMVLDAYAWPEAAVCIKVWSCVVLVWGEPFWAVTNWGAKMPVRTRHAMAVESNVFELIFFIGVG